MFEIPSKKLFEKLREEALKKDISMEELVVEILSKVLNHPLDPSRKSGTSS